MSSHTGNEDVDYFLDKARENGLSFNEDDEEHYLEYVGKLCNDGASDEEARKQAFDEVFRLHLMRCLG